LFVHHVTAKLCVLAGYLGSVFYVHFRGKVRHRFRRQLGDHSTFMAPYNALMHLFSAVPATPILDLEAFPELVPLERHWKTIRSEAERLYEGGRLRAAEKRNDIAFNSFFRRGWKRFYLKWYDDFLPSAEEFCPQTVALVRSIPSINAALFAMLPPRSRLGAHRDPFAGSLRYHLGLVTPNSDACRIHIDAMRYSWRDGEAVLFDETYIHKVKNETDDARIILFCDVTRPLRTPVVRAINRFVIRHLARITAARNVATEKVGFVNHLSAYVDKIGRFSKRLRKINKRGYYLVKNLLALGLLYLFLVL